MNELLIEFRCTFCFRLLARVSRDSSVEIKCAKCKAISVYKKGNPPLLLLLPSQTYIEKYNRKYDDSVAMQSTLKKDRRINGRFNKA